MSTIRITSGLYKNAKLEVPPSAHPMGERERTAIFNSLGDSIKNARVLDIFAGSGALGLESLSRGALHADFLENNREAQRIIKENIANLGITGEKTNVVPKIQNLRFLGGSEEGLLAPTSGRTAATAPCKDRRARVRAPGGKESEILCKYDLIFADPPYDNPQIKIISELIPLLPPSALLVLSLPKDFPPPPLALPLLSQKTYARASILTYQKQ